jgi:hypothetical protein
VSELKRILDELVGARNARSAARAARVLSEGVQYWDCERGHVSGRAAVAAAMTDVDARIDVETAAVEDSDAVLELQIEESARRYRSTEVYRFEGGALASVKAYLDPAARRRQQP